jgi:hypothetical protein
MAADTILMNHISSGLMDENNLRFQPQGKHRCVAHSVFCLEKIFVEHVVVWHMTLVAIGVLPVRAVTPGSVLRRHNVAVDAGLRVVGQIRVCLAHIKQEAKQTDQDADEQQNWESPGFWRK